jgi:hypothetical protein
MAGNKVFNNSDYELLLLKRVWGIGFAVIASRHLASPSGERSFISCHWLRRHWKKSLDH